MKFIRSKGIAKRHGSGGCSEKVYEIFKMLISLKMVFKLFDLESVISI